MDSRNLAQTVEVAVRALTAVSEMSDITSVPSVAEGNRRSHAIGLGQMNLHGYLAREGMAYGSPEALDFTNLYFYCVTYHALRTLTCWRRSAARALTALRSRSTPAAPISTNIPNTAGSRVLPGWRRFLPMPASPCPTSGLAGAACVGDAARFV